MRNREKQTTLIALIAIIIGLSFSASFFNLVNFNQKSSLRIGVHSSMLSNHALVDRWDRTWGSIYDDDGVDVAKDSLDNLYIVGRVSFIENRWDFCVVKYNCSGEFEWYRTWGGTEADYATGVAIDSMGNIYITGFTWSYGSGEADPCLVKFNSLGEFEWYRTWGGTSWDSGYDLVIDASDNIYVTGIYDSGSGDRLDLIKYNSSGDQEWHRTESWGWSVGRAITIDSSSEYLYVTGYGLSTAILAKYNTSGDLEWYSTLGEVHSSGCGIAIDSTNNIYIIESGGNLTKYNNMGVELWSKTPLDVGGVTLDDLILDSSENIYLVGDKYNYWSKADMYLCKFNNASGFEWDLSWGGSGFDSCSAIVLDSEDNVYLAGTKWTNDRQSDLCLVKNPLSTERPPPPPLPPPGTIESQLFQLFLYLFLVCNVLSITGITVYYNNKDPRQLSRD